MSRVQVLRLNLPECIQSVSYFQRLEFVARINQSESSDSECSDTVSKRDGCNWLTFRCFAGGFRGGVAGSVGGGFGRVFGEEPFLLIALSCNS